VNLETYSVAEIAWTSGGQYHYTGDEPSLKEKPAFMLEAPGFPNHVVKESDVCILPTEGTATKDGLN
jgi:hypothetical protein